MLFCSADCVPFKSVSVMTSWIIEPPVTTTWTCRPMISWPLKLAIIIQHWEILWRPSFNNPLEEFPWDGKVFVKGISPAVSHKTWSSGAISSIKAPISTLTIALSSKASSEGKTLIIVDKHYASSQQRRLFCQKCNDRPNQVFHETIFGGFQTLWNDDHFSGYLGPEKSFSLGGVHDTANRQSWSKPLFPCRPSPKKSKNWASRMWP